MNNNYLSHKEGHKYIFKEKVNGKWRYYYTIPETPRSRKEGYIPIEDVGAKEHRNRMRSAYGVASVRHEMNKYNAKQAHKA